MAQDRLSTVKVIAAYSMMSALFALSKPPHELAGATTVYAQYLNRDRQRSEESGRMHAGNCGALYRIVGNE